jgi:hypothetical protein
MRHFTARLLKRTLAAEFALLLLSACALAQTSHKVVWPTYHMDSLRRGQNKDCVDITNPCLT